MTATERAPALIALAGASLVALAAVVFNARISILLLDETIIKQSAVHYTQGLPGSFFHDVNARATSRLYSLLITPLFALFNGDVAVRAARSLNGPLFASAAVPAYLLARTVVRSRWLAALAAVASVAMPWLVLTTAIFTESLAYPLVLWVVLAMAWSFRAPSALRDGLVIVLIVLATGTRTQLIALVGAYVVVVAVRLWLDRRRPGVTWRGWVTTSFRRFPLTLGLVVLGVLVVLWLMVQNTLRLRLRELLGGYAGTTSDRAAVPSDVGPAMLIEGLALSLGVGLVPAILAVAWYPRALRGRLGPAAQAAAVSVIAAMGVLVAATLYSQGGFLAGLTEERYFFYVAPFLWIGAVAAIEAGAVRARQIVQGTIVLALVAALLPLPRVLDPESSFFAPAIVAVHYLVLKGISGFTSLAGWPGLTQRDALAIAVLVLGLGAAALWWRAPRRAAPIVIASAIVVQLVLTLIPFLAIDGRIAGVPGRRTPVSFAQLGFIDRVAGDAPVTWLDNQVRQDELQASTIQRMAMLYNDGIDQRLVVPALAITPDDFPLNALPLLEAEVGPDGRLTTSPLPVPLRYVVETVSSPFLQLEGRVVWRATPELPLQLREIAAPRAVWLATGLSVSGGVAEGTTARLRAWGDQRLRLHFAAVAAPGTGELRFGVTRRRLRLAAKGTLTVEVDSCDGGRGSLSATGGLVLAAVEIVPRPCT